GVAQAAELGLGKIAHARRLDRAERLDPAPSIIACDVAGFLSMVQCGLEDRQNAVRGGATLANPVRTLVRLALVWLAAGLGARERWLCGKAAVPIFDPLDREFGDLQRAERRQAVRLRSPAALLPRLPPPPPLHPD